MLGKLRGTLATEWKREIKAQIRKAGLIDTRTMFRGTRVIGRRDGQEALLFLPMFPSKGGAQYGFILNARQNQVSVGSGFINRSIRQFQVSPTVRTKIERAGIQCLQKEVDRLNRRP